MNLPLQTNDNAVHAAGREPDRKPSRSAKSFEKETPVGLVGRRVETELRRLIGLV